MEDESKQRREGLPNSFSKRYFSIDDAWQYAFNPEKPIAREVVIVVFAEDDIYLYLNGASPGCSEEGAKVKLELHREIATRTCKNFFAKANFFVGTLKNTPLSLSETKRGIANEFGKKGGSHEPE